ELRVRTQHVGQPKARSEEDGIDQLLDLSPNLSMAAQHSFRSVMACLPNFYSKYNLAKRGSVRPAFRPSFQGRPSRGFRPGGQLKFRDRSRNQPFHSLKSRVFLPGRALRKIGDVSPTLQYATSQ